MPPRPSPKPKKKKKEQRCANPACSGVPLSKKGSHNSYGQNKAWAIRKRYCPQCQWRWKERVEVIESTIVKPTDPPPIPLEPVKPIPQLSLRFDD